ncbi:MAG: hypothetical protein HOV81_32100 [Kofleriaceae bacterium]|nr:hypothetical protein [Kofleriaceae bacterium]
MKCWLLALAVLAACEENPSRLDDAFDSSPGQTLEERDWLELDKNGAPLDAHVDLLLLACDHTKNTPADIARRADALIAWMDARGSVRSAWLDTSYGVSQMYGLSIPQLVASRPGDDRLFEAGLYAAAQLRRNGIGVVDDIGAQFIVTKLMKLRPIAPPVADKYAPSDAEVFRVFASEAVTARRSSSEQAAAGRAISTEDNDYLALIRRFANAPTERAAFLAFLTKLQVEHPGTRVGWLMTTARRMFSSVDAYQRWLANRQTL